jgi:hypothetical protein
MDKWRAIFFQLLEFVDAIQRKQLNLTSGVQQVMIMACSTQLDAQSLPLSLVSTIVASFLQLSHLLRVSLPRAALSI